MAFAAHKPEGHRDQVLPLALNEVGCLRLLEVFVSLHALLEFLHVEEVVVHWLVPYAMLEVESLLGQRRLAIVLVQVSGKSDPAHHHL